MVANWASVKKDGVRTPKSGTGVSRGLNKGHVTTKRSKAVSSTKRLSLQKNKLNAVKEVVMETAGLSPYERRIVELLKVQREKRALRFCKRRLGSFARGKKKREIMSSLIRKQAAKAAKKN
eukprot:Rhum_TRINITY_DN12976_c0_g1::Rhum_TRINITY_DN12976_c0_g1_i1::g.55430::m.55430/K02920/RP-L36e, RPL36; large subunit ribosomal protein L36e